MYDDDWRFVAETALDNWIIGALTLGSFHGQSTFILACILPLYIFLSKAFH